MSATSRRTQNRIAKEERLLDAALAVFSRLGYAGASMDAVATEAGLTKPTVYNYFESKEALFKAMMQSRRKDMMLAFEGVSAGAMVKQLHTFAWDYARAVMRPDLLSLARLIIGEAQRFPEIGRAYQTSGPDRLLEGMISYLKTLRAADRLRFEDPELAAQDLWGLILSGPRNKALYEPDWAPTEPELARYIENGLRVFLRAYSTQVEQDLDALETLI